MKISPFVTGGMAFSHHYMMGLSFRLYPDTNTSYGISFFRSDPAANNPSPPNWVGNLPESFESLRNTNVYLVLWYLDDGDMELINYKTLAPPMVTYNDKHGVNDLSNYSTMLLKLDEQVAANGDRENHISAFLQNTNIYANWDSRDDIRWSDDTATFSNPVQWEHPVTEDNVDTNLTSEGFYLDRPSEIGVHVYYDQLGDNKQFFDDFAMKMDGFQSAGPGVDQIQY
jgi:hypothetical protein